LRFWAIVCPGAMAIAVDDFFPDRDAAIDLFDYVTADLEGFFEIRRGDSDEGTRFSDGDPPGAVLEDHAGIRP